MQDYYFTEREFGVPPQNIEKIDKNFWDGLVALIQTRIKDGSFAERFPLICSDALIPIGSDEMAIESVFKAEFPSMQWPLHLNELPDTLSVMDVIEFFYKYISKSTRFDYHSFFKHNHILSFDQKTGRHEYLNDVNRFLRRNKLAYKLLEDGRVIRLEPVGLRETLANATFQTEDQELNRLLELAREKFRDPDINVRREAVEKLWAVWERLKTLESGADKKEQIEALLIKAIPQQEFRERINDEARVLTKIGNDFVIRHAERDRVIITDSEYLDYLFHRLFALIRLLLRRTNRGG